MNEDFFKTLSKSIGKKRIVIYGAGFTGILMLNAIEALGNEMLYFLDQDLKKQKDGFCGYEVKAPEDILYEDMSKTMVVISAVRKKEELEEVLVGLGLRKGVEFIQGGILFYTPCNTIDPFLGYGRSADVNGFKIMGNYDKKSRSILCLGGSTTDYSFLGIKSWPQCLYEVLKKDDVKLNVLNGGIVGYNSSQELLKLIRDGLELDPSLVISFSGFNDFQEHTPAMGSKYLYDVWGQLESAAIENHSQVPNLADSLSLSYGAKTRLSAAEYWYRNELMMCNICRGFDIPFLGILQPTIYTKDTNIRSSYEERMFQALENAAYIKNQFDKAKQLVDEGIEGNIADFTALFNPDGNIYVDVCHVYEHGNMIIAEAIYKKLKEKKLL